MKRRAISLSLVIAGIATWLWWQPSGVSASQNEQAKALTNQRPAPDSAVSNSFESQDVSRPLASASGSEHDEGQVQHNEFEALIDDANLEQESGLQSDEENHLALTTTIIADNSDDHDDASENKSPYINTSAQEAIQTQVSMWDLKVGHPILEIIDIQDLFIDPEGDLLNIRIAINVNGLTMTSSSPLTIQGTPSTEVESPTLVILAQDNHQDSDEWVQASFALPAVRNTNKEDASSLLDSTLYRLESSYSFGGVQHLYEVVYCEAFKLEDSIVYYAKSNTKTHCPSDQQLKSVGSYQQKDDQIQIDLDSGPQTWTLLKHYPAVQQRGVENYFVSTTTPQGDESYTMQKSKAATEAKINIKTGEYQFQMPLFDYLIPLPNGEYVLGSVGNYLYDLGPDNTDINNETIDSDLNMHANSQSIDCSMVAGYMGVVEMGGIGEYDIEVVSLQWPSEGYDVHCGEYISEPAINRQSIFSNQVYTMYDMFKPGEVYSFIMRPKPQYASHMEEIKLNLIYHAPIQ